MPRSMPGLGLEFGARVAAAIKLAEIGEVAKAEAVAGSQTRRNFHYSRVELLYELAYLRIFVGWETFLEQAFFRYLCGYTSNAGASVLLPGQSFTRSLATAENAVLGGQSYFLWHNPAKVTSKAAKFFTSSPLQTVVQSNQSHLEQLAAIRHRITHSQTDARNKFDLVTMAIAGKRYPGSRPGSFLRDVDVNITPPLRWLDILGRGLQSLAAQVG